MSAKEGPAVGGTALPALPPDALMIVPVRNTVLFPGLVLPITLGRPKSIAAAPQAGGRPRRDESLLQRSARAAEEAPGRHPVAALSRRRGSDRDRHAPHGHDRQYRALHHSARRHQSS